MSPNKINTATLQPINKHFYRTQLHNNYKLDEDILKTLIKRDILPLILIKNIEVVIHYNKFKTPNLVINNNNSSPLIEVLPKIKRYISI